MINTPANPSGKVFSQARSWNCLPPLPSKHDLFVFTDEIYEHFVYDGNAAYPPGDLAGNEGADHHHLRAFQDLQHHGLAHRLLYLRRPLGPDHRLFQRSGLCLRPGAAADGRGQGSEALGVDYYESLSREYAAKRDRVCHALKKAGLNPHVPQGAYYILADISGLPGKNSKERAMYLLERTGVASVPGEAFYDGDGGENLARFCFAKEDAVLEEACKRLLSL